MFGVAILFVTAILMLRNVEKALNDICHRPTANRSFFPYWTARACPLAIGLGLGPGVCLAAANELGNIQLFGVGSMPIGLLFISAMGLTCLYVIVLNARCL